MVCHGIPIQSKWFVCLIFSGKVLSGKRKQKKHLTCHRQHFCAEYYMNAWESNCCLMKQGTSQALSLLGFADHSMAVTVSRCMWRHQGAERDAMIRRKPGTLAKISRKQNFPKVVISAPPNSHRIDTTITLVHVHSKRGQDTCENSSFHSSLPLASTGMKQYQHGQPSRADRLDQEQLSSAKRISHLKLISYNLSLDETENDYPPLLPTAVQ